MGQNGQAEHDVFEHLCADVFDYPENGHLRPFQIVSLVDMMKKFLLGVLQNLLRSLDDEEIRMAALPQFLEISKEDDEHVRLLAKFAMEECKRFEMKEWVDEPLSRISNIYVRLNGHMHDSDGRSYAGVRADIKALRQSIGHLLSSRLFLFMPPEDAASYDKPALFGDLVAARFPEANKEITLAGNCYATGHYTACVFHLTRAVEIAARVMVIALKVTQDLKNQNGKVVPVKLCTWDILLTGLQKGVDNKKANISTNAIRRETYEFYNHAVSQFRNFKDAWRNRVSHKRSTYQQGQAKDIMNNVHQFMVHLCGRLKEPKGATFD